MFANELCHASWTSNYIERLLIGILENNSVPNFKHFLDKKVVFNAK